MIDDGLRCTDDHVGVRWGLRACHTCRLLQCSAAARQGEDRSPCE